MPKTNNLLLLLPLIAACATPKDAPEQAPESIGPPLMSWVGARSCGGGYHLYREARQIQIQCFDDDGNFVYDNRGTLTLEAATTLDAEIADADLDDTEPVNWMGGCGAHDVHGIQTLWVGEQSISFEPYCMIRGIVSLYEHVDAILSELDTCSPVDLELLESIEPDCQVVF